MPLFDVYCPKCDKEIADIVTVWNDYNYPCPECGTTTSRLYNKTAFVPNEDSEWVRKDARTAIDPETTDKRERDLRKNPTRSEWLKHMERKEIVYSDNTSHRGRKPREPNMERVNREVCEKMVKRNSIEVQSI